MEVISPKYTELSLLSAAELLTCKLSVGADCVPSFRCCMQGALLCDFQRVNESKSLESMCEISAWERKL